MIDVGTALDRAAAALKAAGIDGPRAEARLLLAWASGLSAAEIFNRPERILDDAAAEKFDGAVARRAAGTPFAHIAAAQEFWSLALRVTPATLIPRADSEAVIALAVDLWAGRAAPARIADLGTGSGCLLLALLSEFPAARGVGLDISAAAAEVAAGNAASLGLGARADFIVAGWDGLPPGPYDLIVANPPYIPTDEIAGLMAEVRDFEPHQALDGGADGLDAYRAILPIAAAAVHGDGVVIFEIGRGQGADLDRLAAGAGLLRAAHRADLGGIDRAIAYRKKSVG